MAALILPSRRVVQPQGPVEIDSGSPLGRDLGFQVSDFTGRDIVGSRFVTKTASLGYGLTALGRGLSSASNAAFSAPLNLSSTNAITVAFISRQAVGTGLQVLLEHTANQNTNGGSFLAYFEAGNLEASVANGAGGAGGYNAIRCPAPAVGRTTKIVFTLERIASTAKAIRVWYDGVEQATTQTFSGTISGTFANSSTFFFGRAAASLFFDGVMHDISLWRRKISDNEVREWSFNPWQTYRPIQRRIWVAVAAGGAATATGTPAAISLSAATATGSGSASASTAPAPISLTPSTAAATGSASASSTPAALSLSAATATAAGSATASATPQAISLTAATATAAGGAVGNASATPAPISLAPGTGSAAGSASASAVYAAVSLTPATATASAGQVGSATGAPASIGLNAATGSATGAAAAFAAYTGITLTPATGTASATSPMGNASGLFAAMSVTAATATADGGSAPLTNAEMRELLDTVRLLKIQLQQVNGYTSLIPALL